MKNIAVLTATRAEYGLLSSLIKKLSAMEDLKVSVLVTGMHLSADFGFTYKEIEADGIEIAAKIPILAEGDSADAMSRTMANALTAFSEIFAKDKFDALVVLGDRYETLAVCCAAMNARIPIIHLHGGETTEGAIDEAIRHAITKMSYLHLTSTEAYRQRVIQMGEDPERVFCIGAPGVENAKNVPLMSKSELFESLNIPEKENFAVMTYHPVTLSADSVETDMRALFKALDNFPGLFIIATKANADAGGRAANRLLEEYAKERENVVVYDSLGLRRYLSAVKYSKAVIGNSSSGIMEVPSFGVPTVNIGHRQRGRIAAESVINCGTDTAAITEAITLALSGKVKPAENPYEKADTSSVAAALIRRFAVENEIDLKKKFYDIKF